MSANKPVASVAEFEALDESDLLLGYSAGFDGIEFQQDWARGFIHGWRNGMLDSGRRQPDQADFQLSQDFNRLTPVIRDGLAGVREEATQSGEIRDRADPHLMIRRSRIAV